MIQCAVAPGSRTRRLSISGRVRPLPGAWPIGWPRSTLARIRCDRRLSKASSGELSLSRPEPPCGAWLSVQALPRRKGLPNTSRGQRRTGVRREGAVARAFCIRFGYESRRSRRGCDALARPARTRMKRIQPPMVQARLDLEAARLDAQYRGTHLFKPIWEVDDPVCNWATSFEMRGSTSSFADMRAAIDRVQADMPLVKFGK